MTQVFLLFAQEKIDLNISSSLKAFSNVQIGLNLISISSGFRDYSNFHYFSREGVGEAEASRRMDDVVLDLEGEKGKVI